ncbi:hypothetical protein Tco_0048984, partial [Tanacetum coccineum]
MAKNSEPDGESDIRLRSDRGIPELTGYGDGGGESPIIKSGYGGGDELSPVNVDTGLNVNFVNVIGNPCIGRKISNIDKDPTISLVHPEQDMEYAFDVSTAEGFTTASIPVTTASAFISTASVTPEVSTAAANLVYIIRSAKKKKDKGKAIMKDDESV